MLLESYTHDSSIFATLTYNNETIPGAQDDDPRALGSLDPEDTKLFLKRLRTALSPLKFRFFLVGEYGDQTWRPHYHAVLFGLDFTHTPVIESKWRHGIVHVGEFNQATAAYTAGYVVKKMTQPDDPRLMTDYRLHPEFARQSQGIGRDAMKAVADQIHTEQGLEALALDGDVPKYLQLGKQQFPLGRYLVSKLRQECGFTDAMLEQLKNRATLEKSVQTQEIFRIQNAANPDILTTTDAILAENKGKSVNFVSRHTHKPRKDKL